MSGHDDELPRELDDIAARVSASRPRADDDTLNRVHGRLTVVAPTAPARGYRMGWRRFATSLAVLTGMVAATGAGIAATSSTPFSSLPKPIIDATKSQPKVDAENIPEERYQRRLKRDEVQSEAGTSAFTPAPAATAPPGCGLLTIIVGAGSGLQIAIGANLSASCIQYALTAPFVFTPSGP